MSLRQRLILLTCLFIMNAAWLGAVTRGRTDVALASAALISLLCAAIILFRVPSIARIREDLHEPTAEDESAEFRRGVFELCAALKLGIRFCEQHLHSEPDALLEELERMRDNIGTFVNRVARPVRFFARRRWPWGAAARERPER